MRRLKKGVLREYLVYSSSTEVPIVFSLWCGLATVSAALGRDAFIDMGHYCIYPNLYTILVAGSAKCRKSTAIDIARGFIHNTVPAIKIFAQKATPVALINALAGDKVVDSTTISSCSEGIIIADELSTLIDRNAFQSGMIGFLTSLWDAKDKFVYHTMGRGQETIYNSCVSILGGSTINWIKESIPITSIGGGFTSRIIFVYQDAYEKLLLRTFMSRDNRERAEHIQHDLNEVAKIRGEFVMEDKLWNFLEEKYASFMKNHPFTQHKYLSGYAGRRFTILLKLCILISASGGDSKEIIAKDISLALALLEEAEKDMPKVLETIAMDEVGAMNFDVLSIIRKHGLIKRKDLVTLVHHQMQAKDLDIILETLNQAGDVRIEIDGKNNYLYKYIGKETKRNRVSFTDYVLEKE